jgi:hypothetical protein
MAILNHSAAMAGATRRDEILGQGPAAVSAPLVGRFWAPPLDLGADDPGRVESGGDESPDEADRGEGRDRPDGKIPLGNFIQRAEELGGSLRFGRRSAFAPGGRGSRFSSAAAPPRFPRLGDAAGWRNPRKAGRLGRRSCSPRREGPLPTLPHSPALAAAAAMAAREPGEERGADVTRQEVVPLVLPPVTGPVILVGRVTSEPRRRVQAPLRR